MQSSFRRQTSEFAGKSAKKGPSGSGIGSLYVKHSDLRNESQDEPRKRVKESLPDDFIKLMIRNAEKLDPSKILRDQGQKNKGEKPQEDILSRLDHFESPESDIPLKFAPCVKGVIQVRLSSN